MPGQARLRSLWEDIAHGALGGLVLFDIRRWEDSFEVVGLVEEMGLPYVATENPFPGSPSYPVTELRESLDFEADPPLFYDARGPGQGTKPLIALVEHALVHASNPHQEMA